MGTVVNNSTWGERARARAARHGADALNHERDHKECKEEDARKREQEKEQRRQREAQQDDAMMQGFKAGDGVADRARSLARGQAEKACPDGTTVEPVRNPDGTIWREGGKVVYRKTHKDKKGHFTVSTDGRCPREKR